jgi:Bacterial SH3 domain
VPVPVQAEPRGDLPPVATVRAGATLAVLGRSETWLRVEAGGRKGYARSDQVAEVR